MVRIQKKISQGLKALRHFSTQQWSFKTDNILKLKNLMNEADREIFVVTEKDIDLVAMAENSAIASKKFFFNEDLSNVEWCKTKLKMWVELFTKTRINLQSGEQTQTYHV